MSSPKMVRVIVFRPTAAPVMEWIPDTLDGMQALVGEGAPDGRAYVQHVPLGDLDLYCAEDGIALNLPPNAGLAVPAHPVDVDFWHFIVTVHPNLAAPGEGGTHYLRGTFFVARRRGSELSGVTDADLARFREVGVDAP